MSTIKISSTGLKFISDIVKEIFKAEDCWNNLDINSQNEIKKIFYLYDLDRTNLNARKDMFELLFRNIIQVKYGKEVYDTLLFIFKITHSQIKYNERNFLPTVRDSKKVLETTLKDFTTNYKEQKNISFINYIFNLKEEEKKSFTKVLSFLVGGMIKETNNKCLRITSIIS